MLHRMKEKHSWLAVVFRSNTSALTRIDRITILLCMVCYDAVSPATVRGALRTLAKFTGEARKNSGAQRASTFG